MVGVWVQQDLLLAGIYINMTKVKEFIKKLSSKLHVHHFWENKDQRGLYECTPDHLGRYTDKQYLIELECKCGVKYLTSKDNPIIIR